MEKVLSLDGVEVIYLHSADVFEVWAMVSNGPDDFDWDVIATVDSSDEAIAIARKTANTMEMIDG